LGKHYSVPHSQSDPESFAVSFVNCVGNTVSFTFADIRISPWESHSNAVASFHFDTGSFARGGSKSSQQTQAVNANISDAVATPGNTLLSALSQYRSRRPPPRSFLTANTKDEKENEYG